MSVWAIYFRTIWHEFKPTGTNSYYSGMNSYHSGMKLRMLFWNLTLKLCPKIKVLLESLKCEIKIILFLKMSDLFRFLNSLVQSVAKPGTVYYQLGRNLYQIGMDSYQVGMIS